MTPEHTVGGPALRPLVVLAAGRATRYGGVKPLAPVGMGGEAVIDVLASDALAAGFTTIVLVLGPETGPAVRYHVERTWPTHVDVRVAHQAEPRGTVDAVLAARGELEAGSSFGVANADDLPGEAGLGLLARHLSTSDPRHALICYRLAATLVGDAPVTRGICRIGPDGNLVGLDERRRVARGPGERVVADDGREPRALEPDSPVSMNLWGFRPDALEMLAEARAAAPSGGEATEILLPEVIGDLVTGRAPASPTGAPCPPKVMATVAPGRCIGVTHPEDVELVRAELAREIGRGERAAQLWSRPPAGAVPLVAKGVL